MANEKHLFTCLLVICISSLEKHLFGFFCPFLNWVIGLIIELYSLDTRYKYMIFKYLLPFCGLQSFFLVPFFLIIKVYIPMLRYLKNREMYKEVEK